MREEDENAIIDEILTFVNDYCSECRLEFPTNTVVIKNKHVSLLPKTVIGQLLHRLNSLLFLISFKNINRRFFRLFVDYDGGRRG